MDMDKRVRVSCLLDFYAVLLTGRQQSILDEHYNQDLSLGEIAQRWDVSRQAVLDTLRRGEAQLEGWEEKLGMFARYQKNTEALERCLTLLDGLQAGDAVNALREELQAMHADWEDANGF